MTARQLEYQAYLKTPHWLNLSAQVKTRDGWKCVMCGGKDILDAHHKIYRARFEDSLPEDLITLCRACHEKAHGIRSATKTKPAQPVKTQAPAMFSSLGELLQARSCRQITRQRFLAERERLTGNGGPCTSKNKLRKRPKKKKRGKKPKPFNPYHKPWHYVRNETGGKWVSRGNSSN